MREYGRDTLFRQVMGLPSSICLSGILHEHPPFNDGDHLCHQDDPFSGIYFVLDGVLKAYRVSPAGEERVLRFNYPGELLWTGGKRTVSVMSVGGSRVCSMSFGSLQRLTVEYPELQMRGCALLGRQLADEKRFLSILSHGGADRRLAFLLLQIRDRLYPGCTDECVFRLPMARIDMGNYLGLRIETVVRTLRKLESDHLIAVNGRNVNIRDSRGLEELVVGGGHQRAASAKFHRPLAQPTGNRGQLL